jgi:hypothetical protein
MNADEFNALLCIARKATSGPWSCSSLMPGLCEGDFSSWPEEEFLQFNLIGPERPRGRGEFLFRDANFIATFNPQRVGELLRTIDRLRYALAIFMHAHETGNSVPPHLVDDARNAMGAI